MKYIVTTFLLLAASAVVVQAQSNTAGPQPSPKPGVVLLVAQPPEAAMAGKWAAFWQPNAAGCDQQIVHGIVYRLMDTEDGLRFRVSLNDLNPVMAAVVRIENIGSQRELIDVSGSWVHEFAPKNRNLEQIAPDQFARRLTHPPLWRTLVLGALVGALSGAADTGTITYSDGTTATYTDPEIDAENARRLAAARAEATNTAQSVKDAALLPETLDPGRAVEGLIYFQRAKEIRQALLMIKIGDVDYGFPFFYTP